MRLIIYTKTGCPWCEEVLDFFDQNSIEYEEKEVISNSEFMEELKSKSGQSKAPTIDIDGEILADKDVGVVKDFLKQKGIL